MAQRMIRGMAIGVVFWAIIGFLLWAFPQDVHADEEQGYPGAVTFGLSDMDQAYGGIVYPGLRERTSYSLIARRNDALWFSVFITNWGNTSITEPVVTEQEWSTGTLRYAGMWGSDLARWSMTTLGLGHFQLVFRPPEGGLLPGQRASVAFQFNTKCNGDFAFITGADQGTGWTQRFNVGLPNRHRQGVPAYTLVGRLVYNNGERPQSGELKIDTRCGEEVARLQIVDGQFTSGVSILVLDEDYYPTFIPSLEEHQRYSGAGLAPNIRPTASSPSTIEFLGTVSMSRW